MRIPSLFFILATALLVACNTNTADSKADETTWPQSQITQTDLGFGEIYGVKITDFASSATAKAYAVQFSLNDKVWLDTLYTTLGANDTVMSEVFFSDAFTKDPGTAKHRIEILDVE